MPSIYLFIALPLGNLFDYDFLEILLVKYSGLSELSYDIIIICLETFDDFAQLQNARFRCIRINFVVNIPRPLRFKIKRPTELSESLNKQFKFFV